MSRRAIQFFLVVVLLLCHSGLLIADAPIAAKAEDIAALVAANNEFAFDLFTQVRATEGNLVVSPCGVSTAMAMLRAGARGESARQIAMAMRFPFDDDRLDLSFASLADRLQREVKVDEKSEPSPCRIANAVWYQRNKNLSDPFSRVLQQRYQAALHPADFVADSDGARKSIAEWVAKQTNGRIDDVIQLGRIGPDISLVIANVVYFKARWKNPFVIKETRDGPFILAGGGKATVPMMHLAENVPYFENDTVQMISLAYRVPAGESSPYEFSLVLLLPGKKNTLAALEGSLNPRKLEDWLRQGVPTEKQMEAWAARGSQITEEAAMKKWMDECPAKLVDAYLPRFKITSSLQLKSALIQLGAPAIFGAGADFSAVGKDIVLAIDHVDQKSFIAVDESGTEAAAVTQVGGAFGGPMGSPALFRADRPFLFVLRENRSGTILYMGRVSDPSIKP
jgi:serpin B